MTKGCKKFQDMVSFDQYTRHEMVDFVERYCHRLNLPQEPREKALEVAHNVLKLNLVTSHQPPSVAAAVILLCNDIHGGALRVTRQSLHDTFKISEVTISKTYRKLQPMVNILADSSITDEVAEALNSSDR